MARLSEVSRGVELIVELKERLVSENNRRRSELDEGQWDSLTRISSELFEACKKRDLDGVAASTRKMKNRLRRRSIKKRLECLEARGEDFDDQKLERKKSSSTLGGKDNKPSNNASTNDSKQPEGVCKCSSCGKIIDGSKEPCIEGALCSDCALKEKVVSKKKQDQKKRKKAVPPTMMPTGTGGGSGDFGGEKDQEGEGKQESILRKRSYFK